MTPDIIIHGKRHRFIPHSGEALGGPSKLDLFADWLADGYSVNDAALKVYGTATVGNSRLQRIRRKLGWQAV
jgi:hypothetical protein